MKFKEKLILGTIMVLSLALIGCSGEIEDVKEEPKKEITKDDLSPIDKKHIMTMLKVEYGSDLAISEEDIKTEGEYYVVDVIIEEWHEESDEHQEGEHVHIVDMGKHKFDMYTGEMIIE